MWEGVPLGPGRMCSVEGIDRMSLKLGPRGDRGVGKTNVWGDDLSFL